MATAGLALRNLRRNTRRSAFTVAMVVLGTAFLVWINGVNEGSFALLTDGVTQGFHGHFQVMAGDFNARPGVNKTVRGAGAVAQALREAPEVRAVTERVEAPGLVSAGHRSVGVRLIGVDAVREPEVTRIPAAVKEGAWLTPGAGADILLGRGVAARLRVKVGDEVSFLGQAADGAVAAQLFRVRGVYTSGSDEADSALAFVTLADARELLELPDRAHRVVGRLHEPTALEAFLTRLPSVQGHRLQGWPEVMPALANYIRTERGANRPGVVIFLAIIAVGVVNTLLMSVFERTRELGILRALGTSPRQVVGLILWEAFFLTAGGVTVGALLGTAMNGLQVPIGDEPMEIAGVVFHTVQGLATAEGNLLYPLVLLVGGLLASLWPALRAARLTPLHAMKET